MTTEPKVMKGPNVEVPFDSDKIQFPVLASPKLDGMRLKAMPDGLYSLTHKPQSRDHHAMFSRILAKTLQQDIVLDCELWSPYLKFNEIMRKENLHKCELYVFDMMTKDEWYSGTERPFMDRVDEYQQWIQRHVEPGMKVQAVDQVVLRTPKELEEMFDLCLSRGLEGCVIRPVLSKYKHGRATLNEGLMFKWKKWVTVDGKIVGFKPATRMNKDAPREVDELGHPKAVHSKQHRTETDAIGSIEVELDDGTRFFAVGASAEKMVDFVWPQSQALFASAYLGKMVEVRYQETGTKDKPRMPAITRWRPDKDAVWQIRPTLVEPASPTLEEAFTPPPRSTGRKIFTFD